jgi:hypothetical protein
MASDNRINQLRRLQTTILRCGGDGIRPQQGVDAAFRNNMGLQAERVGLQSNVQRDFTLRADLFEMIAPTARAAKQHERKLVQR